MPPKIVGCTFFVSTVVDVVNEAFATTTAFVREVFAPFSSEALTLLCSKYLEGRRIVSSVSRDRGAADDELETAEDTAIEDVDATLF